MSVSGLVREDVLRLSCLSRVLVHTTKTSAAALRVLSYLPLPYSASSASMIIPAPLRDAVYDYVAKREYGWFGKDDDCLVLKETELLSGLSIGKTTCAQKRFMRIMSYQSKYITVYLLLSF
ncbi:uncharacterized protein yuxk [Phtheirospermum japonicum]|uniref:Uncharacterized protein yuxk n=1 Tax=Phtheirospermum japonicum TaxID=374723 RepID=A0A830BUI7_9LAMI|nr:uncharacterized protein yuxk [Phtheirospermum japonicum]